MQLEDLQREISCGLGVPAREYIQIGLTDFHNNRPHGTKQRQSTLGILAVGIELGMKSLIARHSVALLYQGIPLDMRTALQCPDLATRENLLRRLTFEICNSTYKTIELDSCITVLCVIVPGIDESLKQELRNLSHARNKCLHDRLPIVETHRIDRATYTVIKVVELLAKEGVSELSGLLGKKEADFVEQFRVDQHEILKKKIAEARKHAKTSRSIEEQYVDEGWDFRGGTCPVCRSTVEVQGSTHEEWEGPFEEGGSPDLSLTFFAHCMKCDSCGLDLEGIDEMKMAGMDTIDDLSHLSDSWIDDKAWDYFANQRD